MFETTLLDASPDQSPVLTRRHRLIAMLAGTTVFVSAWKVLPMLLFQFGPEATLAASLTLGAGVALQALMACYTFAAARQLGLSRFGWLAAVLLASAVGFMAFLIRAARRTGDWRRAAMPMATTLEVAALGTLLLVPLIHTQALDLRNLPDQVVPLPPPPPAVQIVAVVRELVSKPAPSQFHDGRIIAPSDIPKEVARIVDEPAPHVDLPFGVPGGDPNSIGVPMDAFRFYVSRATQTDPPPATQERKVKPMERRVVGGEVQAAKLIYAPKPEYPPIAKSVRVQGTVRLEAIIAVDGRVQNLRVTSGPPLLIQAALDAVSQWRYQPTLLNGEAVEVQTEINVNFILGQ